MNFTEKLARLTENVSKKKASVKAGLAVNAISNYIYKRQIPRADAAVAIARVLGVSCDWLFDDAADWPCPSPSPVAPLASPASPGEDAELWRRQLRAMVEALDGEALRTLRDSAKGLLNRSMA